MGRTDRSPGSVVGRTLSRIRSLQRERQTRDASGLHFAEGVRNFVRCIDHDIDIETIILCRRLLTSTVAQTLARRARQRGTPCVTLTPRQFRDVSILYRASGIGVIVQAHWSRLDRVAAARSPLWLAVDHVRSPGNLGTLLRTSQAVGGGGLIVTGERTDPFHPAVVRGSVGAIFTQRIIRTDLRSLRRWSQRHGCCVIGACPQARLPFNDWPAQSPTVIMLGEERRGLTDEQRRLCTHLVRIPMAPGCDSLNVGVAGSLLMYEARKRCHDRAE